MAPKSLTRWWPTLALAGLCYHPAATMLGQFPSDSFQKVRARDTFSLIPTWRFFAPTPARSDYHLYVRGVAEDGELTEWFDAHPVAPRRAFHIFWAPNHRIEKGLFDVMSALMRVFPYVDGESVHELHAYRVIEDHVSHYCSSHEMTRRCSGYQFAILASGGHDDTVRPSVIFSSRLIPATRDSIEV